MTMRLASLRKIADLKNKMTQQAEWQYAESLRDLETEQCKLQEMVDAHDRAALELHELTAQAVPVQEVQDWTTFMLAQQMQIEVQQNNIACQKDVCTDRHGALTERFMDEQVWIQLQERRRQEHQAAMNKVAQEMLDEMAVTGYRRIRG